MKKRAIEDQLMRELANQKILLLVGARQVGKTTIMKKLQHHLDQQGHTTSFLYLDEIGLPELLDKHQENLWDIIPREVQGVHYVFIDEIQYLADPTRFLKYIYDKYRGQIKLIVSGSSAFYINEKFRDSLAGRKSIYHIQTLSFEEFLDFKDEDQYISMIQQSSLPKLYEKHIRQLYDERSVWGGYPDVVLAPSHDQKRRVLKELVTSYIKKDMIEAGVRHQDVYFKLLQLLATHIGQLTNKNTYANLLDVSHVTIHNYLHMMQTSFHVYPLAPFSSNKAKELTKMPSYYFLDMGLRNYLIDDFASISERLDDGGIIENIALRRLSTVRDYDMMRFWRTKSGNEIDIILPADHRARECKANAKKFSPAKYNIFFTTYPEMKLAVCDRKDTLRIAQTLSQ